MSAPQLMLENEHQHEELCKDGETLPCSTTWPAQLGLHPCHVRAQCRVSSCGYFLDTCGPAASVLVAGVLQVTGLSCLS